MTTQAYAAQLWGLLTPEQRWAAHVHAQLGALGPRKETKEKMSEPRSYEVSLTLTIDHAGYSSKPIETVTLSEQVPAGIDPVTHLRAAINREFNRKFSALDLPFESDPVILDGTVLHG